MKQTRVRITPPTEATVPIHRAIQSSNNVGEAVLLSGGTDPADPTELFSIDGTPEDVLPLLDEQAGVRSAELLSAEQGTTYVYVREASQERAIADAFTADTLVVTLPIRLRPDGSVDLTVLGSGSDLQSAIETARELATVSVLAVQDGWSDHTTDQLTDRQHAVLRAAYEAGYYKYPRTATQDDLAAELDISASTIAEHLRNAERTLVEQALRTN